MKCDRCTREMLGITEVQYKDGVTVLLCDECADKEMEAETACDGAFHKHTNYYPYAGIDPTNAREPIP